MTAVELMGICKRFGDVQANDHVSLSVESGTIHGLVGENGAGKSTIMNILYGYYQPDAGEIHISGVPVQMTSPRQALDHGVGMVHQHFMLVDRFTVLENILLGAEGDWQLKKGRSVARQSIQEIVEAFGLDIDVDRRIDTLSVGQQQRVEILKALYRGARTLILDEPTSVLTPQETDELFSILRNLTSEGRTILFISHKLDEIIEITQAVSVMRGGRVVGHRTTSETDVNDLAQLMVGRQVDFNRHAREDRRGDPAVIVEGLSVVDPLGVERVRNLDFTLHYGEILGIAGVSGNGQSELIEALAGMSTPTHGRVELVSTDGSKSKEGPRIAHVPEDRQHTGMIGTFPAFENAVIGYHDQKAYGEGWFLTKSSMVKACTDWMEKHDVRPRNAFLNSINFSGGNQQKLVMAREIEHEPDILLIAQPTRGVDIGAIESIHEKIMALRDQGKAILLISVELAEILALSDRILVMNEGRIVGEMAAEGADQRRLGRMMGGVAEEERV